MCEKMFAGRGLKTTGLNGRGAVLVIVLKRRPYGSWTSVFVGMCLCLSSRMIHKVTVYLEPEKTFNLFKLDNLE
jgi:hypothetical protein